MRTWLLTFGAIAALAAISVVLFTGGGSRGGTFWAGPLWVRYEVSHAGRMPERLEYAVISQIPPTEHTYDDTTETWRFSYSNGDVVTFKTKRGETFWIDGNHKLLDLGRVLEPKEIDLVQAQASAFTTMSPDEFVMFIKKLSVAPSSE